MEKAARKVVVKYITIKKNEDRESQKLKIKSFGKSWSERESINIEDDKKKKIVV